MSTMSTTTTTSAAATTTSAATATATSTNYHHHHHNYYLHHVNDNNNSIICACIWNIGIGLVTIVILTIRGHNANDWEDDEDRWTGWIAVVGASVVFGSTGIPFKIQTPTSSSSSSSSPFYSNPIWFAMCSNMGIGLLSLPMAIILLFWHEMSPPTLDSSSLSLSFWCLAMWGNILIMMVTMLALDTVRCVGVTKGPSIWASVGMVQSFALGVAVLNEPVAHWNAALASLPCLMAGVVLILSCPHQDPVEITKTTTNCMERTRNLFSLFPCKQVSATTQYSMVPFKDDHDHPHDDDEQDDNNNEIGLSTPTSIWKKQTQDSNMTKQTESTNVSHDENQNENVTAAMMISSSSSSSSETTYWKFVGGIALGICTGFMDGSLMVPFKLTQPKTILQSYQYLAAFGLCSFITTPVAGALLYFYYYCLDDYYHYYCWTRKRNDDQKQNGTDDRQVAISRKCTTSSSIVDNDDDTDDIENKEQDEEDGPTAVMPAHASQKFSAPPCQFSCGSSTMATMSTRRRMIPGILSGVLWALANIMSVQATFHLSMRVAFPLTQTAVLFAAAWGIFYFREIVWSYRTLVQMTAGLACFLLGSYLLAASSSWQ